MNQVVRTGLNVGGGTMNIMLQRTSTMVDHVFILDSFVGNNNMSSSSLSSSSTTRRVGLGMNDHVPVSNPPWSMLDHTILFDSNSISNMAHQHPHNLNVARANRANYQNFQELFVAIDDDEPTTTKGSSSKSADFDSMCCICLTELSTGSSTAIRMPKHCCSHSFHRDCIQEWLNVNMTCPLCRRGV